MVVYARRFFTAIFFGAVFFGRDLKKRGYLGGIGHGNSRRNLLFAKLMIFVPFVLLFSFLQLWLGNHLYGGDFSVLPVLIRLKGFGMRMLCDLGLSLLFVPAAYLCRDIGKTVCLNFAGMTALLSVCPALRDGRLIWVETLQGKIWLVLLAGVGGTFLLSGGISCFLFCRSELK